MEGSAYAKAIVAAIGAVLALLGVVIAPEQLDTIAAGVIAALTVLGVWRVPNAEV